MIYFKLGNIIVFSDLYEAIVNSANGIGVLGKGVAGAIRDSAGYAVQDEAKSIVRQKGFPFEPGECYKTGPGKLYKNGVKNIYHAVTMKMPGSYSSVNDIRKAMINVLKMAIEDKIKSIAFPGLGTGIGGLSSAVVAENMLNIALEYHDKIDIYFVDKNEDFIKPLKKRVGLS